MSGGVGTSEEVFRQEHMFPPRLPMGRGACNPAHILKAPEEVFPLQLILSSLSCHHGSSCQALPLLLRSGCGRLPGTVASRNRESRGKGRLLPQLPALCSVRTSPLTSPVPKLYVSFVTVLELVGAGFYRKL